MDMILENSLDSVLFLEMDSEMAQDILIENYDYIDSLSGLELGGN